MVSEMMNPSALVDGARTGDAASWTALYRLAYPQLIRYAHHRLGDLDEARDAVSETMARAVAAMDRFTADDAGFVPWLFGICRNVVADALRLRYRQRSLRDVEDHEDDGPSPDEDLLDREDLARVRAAFARLDPDEREVLELRVVAGLTSDQVAGVLGKKPSAVRMAQMRALSRLRAFVNEAASG